MTADRYVFTFCLKDVRFSQCADWTCRETLDRTRMAYVGLDDGRGNFVSRIKRRTWNRMTVCAQSQLCLHFFTILLAHQWEGVEFFCAWIFLAVTSTFYQLLDDSRIVYYKPAKVFISQKLLIDKLNVVNTFICYVGKPSKNHMPENRGRHWQFFGRLYYGRQVAGACEYGNELPGSIKCGEFHD